MAMGWSAEAQTILTSNHIEGRLRAYIDVKYGGAYGVDIVEVTDRVIEWGEIERATSAIDQNFNTCQIITRFRNDDAYFTPNFMAGARDQIANVWTCMATEADYKDCNLYIDFEIKLSGGSWESIRMVRGRIADMNLTDDKGPACELVVKDIALSALDTVLTLTDGPNVEYTL